MKKSIYLFLAFLTLGIFLGFSNSDNPTGLTKRNFVSKIKSAAIVTDINNNNSATTGFDYYSDDFTGPNDTAALKARGYQVYRNGTFTGVVPPSFWRTGLPPPSFPAFNGADTDYVGSGYLSAGDLGDIDNWLVLPSLNVVALDSICFYSRSVEGVPWPDSIRVMFNPLGGTLPSSPGWMELGRFEVNRLGFWELRSFVIPSTATGARLAIRYSVVDGGGNGANSYWIGIDALRVQGEGVLPVELANFVSVITNNNVTLNWSTATETNNSGFEIERSNVKGQTSNEWNKIAFIPGSGTTNSPKHYSFTDRNLNSGNYNYRLKQIDLNGNFEYHNLSNEVVIGVPSRFELSQNYPNPFNPSTIINYQLPSLSNVKLSVYDISGKEVKSLLNGKQEAGYYTFELNASDLSSGIYFYTLTTENFVETKKMMLLK